MVKEHGFNAQDLRRIFSSAERKDSILEAIARPAEKRLSWGEYRKIFMTDARIDGGVEFWRQNAAAREGKTADLQSLLKEGQTWTVTEGGPDL